MVAKKNFVRHIFGGGWATDRGPTVDIVPDSTGAVVLPFVTSAENVRFLLDGGVDKTFGTKVLNSSAVGGPDQIVGIYDYWAQGTAGTPTQKRVIHAGTKIYKDDADGTFDSLFTGLEDEAVPSYSTFDDILIIASDSTTDVPKSWDQTTAQNLAGSPPNFAFSVSHKNRLWAAGDVSNPSRLYYSASLDPEDWTGTGSGNIDIDPNDGDMITGIHSYKNELWAFKGPYKGSIHRITGSSPTGGDSFARTTFIRGLGAVWHNTITMFKDDLLFMWADGTIRSLKATEAFGDFREATLSRDINEWLEDHVNFGQLRYVWAADNPSASQVAFAIPIDSATLPNVLLVMDYRFNPVRWAKWDAYDATSIAVAVDQTENDKRRFYIGGSDGVVRTMGHPNRSIDGTSAINGKVTTPYLNYGQPIQMKTIHQSSVGIKPQGNYNLTFGWTRDDKSQQTTTIDQGGTDVLAPADANEFTLGTSTLGGAQFLDRYVELHEGGEFRSIQYEITQSGNNEGMEVHSISAAITGGSWSTEN